MVFPFSIHGLFLNIEFDASIFCTTWLGKGSEFKLKKISQQDTNSGKATSRLELALVASSSNGNGQHEPDQDNLKEIMLKCVRDSVEIVNAVKEVPFQTCDIRSVAATLFIARTKQFA